VPRGIDFKYTELVFKETGHLAAWLPTKHIAIGDVGPLRGTLFAPEFRVDLGDQNRRGHVLDSLEIATPGAVDIDVKAPGTSATDFRALTKGDAGLAVSFRGRGAVFVQMGDYRERGVEDVRDARKILESLLESGTATSTHLLVTSVFNAMHLSVLIASAPVARMEFRARSDHSGRNGSDRILGLLGDLEPVHRSGMGTVIIGAVGQTPLFGGVRRRPDTDNIEQVLFGDRGVTDVSGVPDQEDSRFEYVGLS
jgi:hypothetical protein